jgi:hypothetical protein
MCSGCSGRFDEEEDWDPLSYSDDDFYRLFRLFGGEPWIFGHAGFQGADDLGEAGAEVVDVSKMDEGEYDIWVSSDRIVERRVIRAK